MYIYEYFIRKAFNIKDIKYFKKLVAEYKDYDNKAEISNQFQINRIYFEYLELEAHLRDGDIFSFSKSYEKIKPEWEKDKFDNIENLICADIILNNNFIDRSKIINENIERYKQFNNNAWIFEDRFSVEKLNNKKIRFFNILKDIVFFENSLFKGAQSSYVKLKSQEIILKITNFDKIRFLFLEDKDFINHYKNIFNLFKIIDLLKKNKYNSKNFGWMDNFNSILFPEWKNVFEIIDEFLLESKKIEKFKIYQDEMYQLTTKYPIYNRLVKSIRKNLDISHELYRLFNYENRVRRENMKNIEEKLLFENVSQILTLLDLSTIFSEKLPNEDKEINPRIVEILQNHFKEVEMNVPLSGRQHIDIVIEDKILIEVKKLENRTALDELLGQIKTDLRITGKNYGIALGFDQTVNRLIIDQNQNYEMENNYIIKKLILLDPFIKRKNNNN